MNMTHSDDVILRTDLPLPNRREGKVRDIYDVPASDGHPGGVLIIATDRISAFDVVLPTAIPGKGKLLTDISVRWFALAKSRLGMHHHLISTDPNDIPGLNDDQRASIAGRMMFGRAASVIPIECVVRGNLAGSGWVDYQESQSVCGIDLPSGLRLGDKLPAPIFTPATKAPRGSHDENISLEQAAAAVGSRLMAQLRDLSLDLYSMAADHAAQRGVLLADTKFEFGFALDQDGRATDELLLIDEIFTPDSSRYWPVDTHSPGKPQESFDKQFVRNYLLTLVADGTWDKTAPGPELPADVIEGTLAKYREARTRLFD